AGPCDMDVFSRDLVAAGAGQDQPDIDVVAFVPADADGPAHAGNGAGGVGVKLAPGPDQSPGPSLKLLGPGRLGPFGFEIVKDGFPPVVKTVLRRNRLRGHFQRHGLLGAAVLGEPPPPRRCPRPRLLAPIPLKPGRLYLLRGSLLAGNSSCGWTGGTSWTDWTGGSRH